MTVHWIEESVNGEWTLCSNLIGFANMQNKHNGVRLGQALYKILCGVGIAHLVRCQLSGVTLLTHKKACLGDVQQRQ